MDLGFFAQVTQAVTNAVTSYEPVFLSQGVSVFRYIADIRIFWEGFKIAFPSAGPSKLAESLVLISITYAALTFYSAPFPGTSKGLTKTITDAGLTLAQQIDTASEQNVGVALANAMGENSGSAWDAVTNGAAFVRYWILEAVVIVMQAAILAVIAVGFIFVGVCVLTGPIFIPFLLIPGLEWLATGWFRCFIQYSFYPVIGNAVVFIIAQVWMNYMSQYSFPMDTQTIAAALTGFATMAIASVYMILKVPAFVSNHFSGSSGISTF